MTTYYAGIKYSKLFLSIIIAAALSCPCCRSQPATLEKGIDQAQKIAGQDKTDEASNAECADIMGLIKNHLKPDNRPVITGDLTHCNISVKLSNADLRMRPGDKIDFHMINRIMMKYFNDRHWQEGRSIEGFGGETKVQFSKNNRDCTVYINPAITCDWGQACMDDPQTPFKYSVVCATVTK
jgi:hypothetical protein